jgi:hypothetical protein
MSPIYTDVDRAETGWYGLPRTAKARDLGCRLFHCIGRSLDTWDKREGTFPEVRARHGEKVTFITGP